MPSGFSKKSIPEQFADKLEEDIRVDKFGAMLPSIRELVLRYDLNPVSVHKGLVILVARGVLINRGPRRRLVIATRTDANSCPAASSDLPCCRPLVFVGAEMSQVNAAVVLALKDVEAACRAKGTACVTVELAGLDEVSRVARIREAYREHRPSHVLLIYCDQQTFDVLERKSCKVAVIGGTVASPRVERLTADMALLSMAAFEDMRTLGHRRFRMVMLGRNEVAAEKRRLLDYSALTQLEAEGVWTSTLDSAAMSSVLGPALKAGVTAFAFPRPESVLLALAYFDMHGLRVPEDVSYVMLLSGSHDFMRTKEPAHFKFRNESVISLIMTWFESGQNTAERFTREMVGTYVRGKTVGPAKKGN